jgi:hypothetical protein
MDRIQIPDTRLCRIATFTALAVGPLGMFVSLLFLDSPRGADIASGAAGFLAGAVLAAAGLVSLSLLIHRVPGSSR